MTGTGEDFFRDLGREGRHPSLAKASGAIRFDLVDGDRTDRWLVSIDRGDVSVSRGKHPADCVVHTDASLFEGIVRGKKNSMAASLRGELTFEGNAELLVLMQRVLPGAEGGAG